MFRFGARTSSPDEVALTREDSTLPYDLRSEFEWMDFSCTSNPLGVPTSVKKAIVTAVAEGDVNFIPDRAGNRLAAMLSRYFEMPAECFLAGTSVSSMIASVAQAYRPCNVGIPTPAPAEYFLSVANVGHNPIKLTNPFSLSAINPQNAFAAGLSFEAAVLANPSYPCARLLKESTLNHYLDVCNWVVLDESGINLTMGGESYACLTQKRRNLLVVRSLSQDLGMTGIPMGYVVGHPDTIAHIRQFCDGMSIGMFPEVIASELPKLEEYTEQTNKLLDAEIPWMQCMLSLIPGIKVFPSEANYVMCALEERAARDFGISGAADLLVRLQNAGYAVRDLCGTPGIEGSRCFLVAIRSHEDNERFLAALRGVVCGNMAEA